MEKTRFALLFGSLSLLSSYSAQAQNLNAFAGSNVRSNERGLIAAELVWPFIAEVGPFLEWSSSTSFGWENRYRMGFVGRITTPWLNFFVDARATYGWNSTSNYHLGGSGPGLELGAGYRFNFPKIDLLPRIGVNAVTPNDDIPLFNLSIGIAIPLSL